MRESREKSLDLKDCPFCNRPLHEQNAKFANDEDPTSPAGEHGFVDPDYFRMLADSIPASPNSSRPSSPFKQLPPLQPDEGKPQTFTTPPVEAEFVTSAPAPLPEEHNIRGSSFNQNYFQSFFVEKRELGRGGRGVVLLVEHILDGVFLGEFACKRIPVGNDHSWLEKVLLEVQYLVRLNHQNLVSYRHVWLEDAQVTKFGPSVPCIFILQQYCNAGDLQKHVLGPNPAPEPPRELRERLRRRSKIQSEFAQDSGPRRMMQLEEIYSFFRDITSGLHHLHSNGYIHRDLKPSNCLLHNSGSKLTVHVSDFGEVQTTNAKRTSTGATGTISYCAPEVLQRNSPEGQFGNFTTKSDIFSLGMIVYFMCFGHLPYANADGIHEEDEDVDLLREEVAAWGGFDEPTRTRSDLPDRLYSFLRLLLSPNPAERPSTDQILRAIKGGGDIDITAPQPSSPSEKTTRITAVDSPAPNPDGRPHLKHVRSSLNRPRPSPTGRHQSSGELVRSRSPTKKRQASNASPSTALESGVVVHTRKVETSSPPPQAGAMGPAPRLMLAAPVTLQDKATAFIRQPATVTALRGTFFFIKLVTLSWPCAPYAANPWVFYPLALLSTVDLLLGLDLTASTILLGLHMMVFSAVALMGRLCSQRILHWESHP